MFQLFIVAQYIIYFLKKREPMLFIFISTFQNLYIFEQNSSFVLSNVPIVKSTGVFWTTWSTCYEAFILNILISYCTENEPNRDHKTDVRTEQRFLCTVTPLLKCSLYSMFIPGWVQLKSPFWRILQKPWVPPILLRCIPCHTQFNSLKISYKIHEGS